MRQNLGSFIAASLLALSIVALGCAGPFSIPTPTPSPTTIPFKSRVLNIAAGASDTLEVAAGAGDTVLGWVVVQGEKAEIDYSVQAPDGSAIVARKRYTGRFDFQFPAAAEGTYKLVFDNSFDKVDKGVLVSYKIAPAVTK